METKTHERYSFSSWAFCEHFTDGTHVFLQPDMDNVELLQRAGKLVNQANAAPDLLEALELADRAITKLAKWGGHDLADLDEDFQLSKIDAAIAKAKGEA